MPLKMKTPLLSNPRTFPALVSLLLSLGLRQQPCVVRRMPAILVAPPEEQLPKLPTHWVIRSPCSQLPHRMPQSRLIVFFVPSKLVPRGLLAIAFQPCSLVTPPLAFAVSSGQWSKPTVSSVHPPSSPKASDRQSESCRRLTIDLVLRFQRQPPAISPYFSVRSTAEIVARPSTAAVDFGIRSEKYNDVASYVVGVNRILSV
jgi:hypothetical protein